VWSPIYLRPIGPVVSITHLSKLSTPSTLSTKEIKMKREMLNTVDAALSRFDDEIDLSPGETSLSFLQKIYRSPAQPMSRRLRAAMAALPHEHPKLGAIATLSINGDDFASQLDRAIERSSMVNAIDVTPTRNRRPPLLGDHDDV
jgi:hypothetical protein